jgi:uncharacterized membrane protein YukC
MKQDDDDIERQMEAHPKEAKRLTKYVGFGLSLIAFLLIALGGYTLLTRR